MYRRALISLVAGIVVLSCGDETTINNYDLTSTGVIHGTISPIEIETFVQLDSSRTFIIGEDGEFMFAGVPPGSHVIMIDPPTSSPRRLGDIQVWPGQVHLLGEIQLTTLPYPVFDVAPDDGDTFVSATKTTSLRIVADESLDIIDLNSKTTIVPPMAGYWHGESNLKREQAGYYFYADEPETPPGSARPPRPRRIFRIGTTYDVKIDGTVRTALGTALGQDIEFSFSTEPLTVEVSIPTSGLAGGVRLRSFIPTLYFNDSINADSVARAVSFAPSLEGIWVLKQYDECSFLPADGPLEPATTYAMFISDSVPLAGSARLTKSDTTQFVTEPVGVSSFYPCNGCSGSNIIRFEFNVPMDQASVESAFSLTTAQGDTLEFLTSWEMYGDPSRIVSFKSAAPLQSGYAYRISLTQAALSAEGYPIYQEHVSYFLAY